MSLYGKCAFLFYTKGAEKEMSGRTEKESESGRKKGPFQDLSGSEIISSFQS